MPFAGSERSRRSRREQRSRARDWQSGLRIEELLRLAKDPGGIDVVARLQVRREGAVEDGKKAQDHIFGAIQSLDGVFKLRQTEPFSDKDYLGVDIEGYIKGHRGIPDGMKFGIQATNSWVGREKHLQKFADLRGTKVDSEEFLIWLARKNLVFLHASSKQHLRSPQEIQAQFLATLREYRSIRLRR